MNKPTISIITVNFNNNEGLIKTINSIKQQSFTAYEHLIIDAYSTDGSKETILQYAKESNHLTYWVSEPDSGIYDGMNKGIEQASGEYLYFLNSGDRLTKDILQAISLDGTKYIFGNVRFIGIQECFEVISPDKLDTLFFLRTTLPHQGCFIHYSLFSQRKYDTHYKIVSDWIHIMHSIILEGCSYKHLPLLIAEYDGGGISTTQPDKVLEERSKWIDANIPIAFLNAFKELTVFRDSEFASIIPLLSKTRRFQKRAKKLVMFLYQINSFFSHKK